MDFSSPPGRELQGVIIKRDALEDTGIFPASYIWVLNLSLVRRGFEQRKEAIMLSVHPLHIREDYRTKKKFKRLCWLARAVFEIHGNEDES